MKLKRRNAARELTKLSIPNNVSELIESDSNAMLEDLLNAMEAKAVDFIDDAEYHIDMGRLNLKLRRYKASMRCFDTALEIAPHCALLYWYRYKNNIKRRRYDDVLLDSMRLARHNQNHPHATLQQANTCRALAKNTDSKAEKLSETNLK